MLTGREATKRYRTGYRCGGGSALAVIRPGSLVQQWQVLQACVQANVVIILQASNTGLTGGSTPNGDYDRDVVIISTARLRGTHVIDEGRQVVCLPGATLYQLEKVLKPYGREPHSVIGSSCIGASVIGGICNNSGGALVQRGPAFTELALYARVGEDGVLRLVNHLGIDLGEDAENALERLERGAFGPAEIGHDPDRRASDRGYCDHVREVDASTPARFNADEGRLFEASGSAGKLALFAVRLDTFPKARRATVFYIGSNDPNEFARLRRDVLKTFTCLPAAGEYLHRTAFDIAERYGKDTVVAIEALGADRLPILFALKSRLDALAARLGLREGFSDRLLQALGRLAPPHLPERMTDFRDRFEHHLLLRMEDEGIEEARAYLTERFAVATGDYFECTPDEAAKAFLHRFAAAGAAVRYRALHADKVEGLIALDIALPRNEGNWFEVLPPDLEAAIVHKLYYGHFFCHVFHQDYVVAKGQDIAAIEHRMHALLDERGAEYPAEHNVGHVYRAKPALAGFYRRLDPGNRFNPGIGHTPKAAAWGCPSQLMEIDP